MGFRTSFRLTGFFFENKIFQLLKYLKSKILRFHKKYVMERHFFCRTRNDRGFIARYRFTSERLCTGKVRNKDFPVNSEWFLSVCSVKRSQKTTHCSSTDLALTAFVTTYFFLLVQFLDISFPQLPLVKFLDIFITPCKVKRGLGDDC